MGTTLTPEFWRQFAVLLVIATAVTVVVSAALDALVLRMRARRTAQWSPGTSDAPKPRSSQRTPVLH